MNPSILVPMREIAIDDRLQPRQDGLSDDHVAALMETPENWPPVVLARVHGGQYLIDGFHRHEAACLLEFSELTATVFDAASDADLFNVAFATQRQARPTADAARSQVAMPSRSFVGIPSLPIARSAAARGCTMRRSAHCATNARVLALPFERRVICPATSACSTAYVSARRQPKNKSRSRAISRG